MTIVYLDELAALNFLCDYLLLRATAELRGLPRRRGRCFLSALLGGAWGACAMLPPLRFLAAPTDQGHSGTVDAGRVLEWVDKARVPELPIWEGDKIFFRLLEQDRPFFSLKLVYAGDRLTQARLDGAPLPL